MTEKTASRPPERPVSRLVYGAPCAHGLTRSYCVICCRQALWDVFRLLGGDTDGDTTPGAIVSDLCQHVIDLAREHREDYDALLATSENAASQPFDFQPETCPKAAFHYTMLDCPRCGWMRR